MALLLNTDQPCLCLAHLRLLHLVVADELSVASVGSDQLLVVTILQHFAILQNQNVITELQELQRHESSKSMFGVLLAVFSCICTDERVLVD